MIDIDYYRKSGGDVLEILKGVCKNINYLENEINKLKHNPFHTVLVVEDGSVDTDKLEKDGFYVILYRQGSQPPMILGKGERLC